MSAHYILTEPSLLSHWWKGREGKGSRKGIRVACDSIHRHLGDTARPATMDAPQSGGDR